jgi:CheY-like chemotaxis protein
MVTVLIVDDHGGVREVIREYLCQYPLEFLIVGEAADGRQALALAESLRPDVVLMDIHMPKMDGITATRALSSRRDAPGVITYTGYATERLEALARAAGACDHLSKPFRLDTLREKIARAAAAAPRRRDRVLLAVD